MVCDKHFFKKVASKRIASYSGTDFSWFYAIFRKSKKKLFFEKNEVWQKFKKIIFL